MFTGMIGIGTDWNQICFKPDSDSILNQVCLYFIDQKLSNLSCCYPSENVLSENGLTLA